jgi:hypothetical protein
MAAVVALVCMLPPPALDRLPPFAPPKDRPKGLIWRRGEAHPAAGVEEGEGEERDRGGMTAPATWPTSAPPDPEAEKKARGRPRGGMRPAARCAAPGRRVGAGKARGTVTCRLERSSKRNGCNLPPRRGKLNLSRLSPNLPVAKAG